MSTICSVGHTACQQSQLRPFLHLLSPTFAPLDSLNLSFAPALPSSAFHPQHGTPAEHTYEGKESTRPSFYAYVAQRLDNTYRTLTSLTRQVARRFCFASGYVTWHFVSCRVQADAGYRATQ